MGTHHDQVRREFPGVIHDATGHICGLAGVDVALHGQVGGERAPGNPVQVSTGFVWICQMGLAVNGRGGIAFDDVNERDRGS
jgi:hypothetical protein